MGGQPTHPGVYVREIPSGVRSIVGAATSVAAFAGRARRGPTNEPVRCFGYGDFERRFGGLWAPSAMSFAVQQYFMNGGGEALIVRISNGATATAAIPGGLSLEACSPGDWGSALRAHISHDISEDVAAGDVDRTFSLTLNEVDRDAEARAGGDAAKLEAAVLQRESFFNVSVDPSAARYVGAVLEQQSDLARLTDPPPATRPVPHGPAEPLGEPFAGGTDGDALADDELAPPAGADSRMGIFALEEADGFNLLCIPPATVATDTSLTVWERALAYCVDKRAMLLVDPPTGWGSYEDAAALTSYTGLRSPNAVLYYPRVRIPDALRENALTAFVPCGVAAGVIARTDAERGIWKAPAGVDASLRGVRGLVEDIAEGESGRLNPQGVNALRNMGVPGHVCWGARTLVGADEMASEWKYLSVRRVALHIEESLFRGTKWAVFEPNDRPLWDQMRLAVGTFMHELFRRGAFQGTKPKDAYFVKCDAETTTQADIDRGVLNVLVGFAPLKPAEFVVLKFQQIAGQTAA